MIKKIHRNYYAVIGNPIKHSYSPRIHNLFSEQFNLHIKYELLLATRTNLFDNIKKFIESGGKGLNITVPFKEEIFKSLIKCNGNISKHASLAKSVNTLYFTKNGEWHGHNTDGIGFIKDLYLKNIALKGSKVLLIGAGGAARGILGPLSEEGCEHIHIVNRTSEKAQEICQFVNQYTDQRSTIISSGNLESSQQDKWNLVINATTSSLKNVLPNIPEKIYADNSTAYDMMYGINDTIFMKNAKRNGAKQCFDGLGMLVLQAAESFFVWHRIYPNIYPVLTSLRNMPKNL
ncbi:MAG: shikimate dehydrogenase [Bordetella sp.]|nr:MAG: shikimate dehydrogenase [Bordetella sp.]